MVVNFTESFLASSNYQYYLRHAKAYGVEKSVVGQEGGDVCARPSIPWNGV